VLDFAVLFQRFYDTPVQARKQGGWIGTVLFNKIIQEEMTYQRHHCSRDAVSCAVNRSYVGVLVCVEYPRKVATYNIFGFMVDEDAFEFFSDVTEFRDNGILDSTRIVDAVGDVFVLSVDNLFGNFQFLKGVVQRRFNLSF
jgi:hypothetical protein